MPAKLSTQWRIHTPSPTPPHFTPPFPVLFAQGLLLPTAGLSPSHSSPHCLCKKTCSPLPCRRQVIIVPPTPATHTCMQGPQTNSPFHPLCGMAHLLQGQPATPHSHWPPLAGHCPMLPVRLQCQGTLAQPAYIVLGQRGKEMYAHTHACTYTSHTSMCTHTAITSNLLSHICTTTSFSAAPPHIHYVSHLCRYNFIHGHSNKPNFQPPLNKCAVVHMSSHGINSDHYFFRRCF